MTSELCDNFARMMKGETYEEDTLEKYFTCEPCLLIRNYLKRLSTFFELSELHHSAELLAEAGFHYTNRREISCYYCNVTLSSLFEESPWEIHTNLSPTCPFVKNYNFLSYKLDPDDVVKIWLSMKINRRWLELGFTTREKLHKLLLEKYHRSRRNFVCLADIYFWKFRRYPNEKCDCEKKHVFTVKIVMSILISQ